MKLRDANGRYISSPQKQTYEQYQMRRRKYYLANRENIIKRATQWNRENKEKRNIIKNKWRINNRAATNYLTRQYIYRRKHALGSHTQAQESWLYSLYDGRCAYCLQARATSLDHILPLSRGGSNSIENLLPACVNCNSKKGAKTLGEWRPIDALTLNKIFGSYITYGYV